MPTVYQLVPEFQAFLDANGNPLSGGELYTYTAGTTSGKTTYTEPDGLVANANPIVLDSSGRAPSGVYGTTGAYKLVLKDSSDVTIRTRDNVTGANDVAGSFTDWTAFGNTVTYISSTSFSVAGDQTTTFTQYRRIKATVTSGTVYGAVASSVFGAGITTVTLTMDSTGLDSGLSSVSYSLLTSQQDVVTATRFNAILPPAFPVTYRNRVINGGMAIDQRNEGASLSIVSGAAKAYTVDRWYAYCTGANVTGQRVAGSGQSQYRYRFTGAASVTAIGFGTRLEAANTYDMAGQTCVLSIDLANSLLNAVTWTAYYANSTDAFGSIASPTRTQIATGTFSVTSSVTRFSTQISVPSAATTGIEIVFTVGAQTSGTWTIGEVQFELGTVAGSVDRRPYPVELFMCQRYYRKTFKPGVVPAQNAGYDGCLSRTQVVANINEGTAWRFDPPMRATPTPTYFNPAAANNQWSTGGVSAAAAGTPPDSASAIWVYNSSAPTIASGAFAAIHATADAEL